MAEPRELFPVTFMGPSNIPPANGGVRNPDGTLVPSLAEVPEPTAEELALLEAGDEPTALADITEPTVGPLDTPATTSEMAGAVGKGKGAAAKG